MPRSLGREDTGAPPLGRDIPEFTLNSGALRRVRGIESTLLRSQKCLLASGREALLASPVPGHDLRAGEDGVHPRDMEQDILPSPLLPVDQGDDPVDHQGPPPRARSMAVMVEPPVVITSSIIATFSPGDDVSFDGVLYPVILHILSDDEGFDGPPSLEGDDRQGVGDRVRSVAPRGPADPTVRPDRRTSAVEFVTRPAPV